MYALILQPLIRATDYIKRDSELGGQLAEATEILKKNSKGVPSGGSTCSKTKQ